MRRTAEFDAFGPWIYQVRSHEDVPRLYHRAGIDPAAHRLVLKIPRDIERRNANPDMHLYDFLIALDGDALTILQRQEERYEKVRIPVGQITALEDSVSLLDGRLIVHTFAGPTTINYNATDPRLVRNLIALLRQSYLPARAAAAAQSDSRQPDLGRRDLNLTAAGERLLRAEPGMQLISVGRRRPAGTGHWLRPMTLHASITCADPREIVLLHRRDPLSRGNETAHSVARTFLPRRRITDVHVEPHEKYPQINVVTIILGGSTLRFPVQAGPLTDSLVDLLLAVTG